jgi:hypothetical protein
MTTVMLSPPLPDGGIHSSEGRDMRTVKSMAVIALLVASVACASGGASSGPRTTTDRDVITEAEIQSRASDAANAFQIIQKLRPQMMRTRGLASPSDRTGESVQPKVYLDNVEYGAMSQLSNVNATQIREIRFLNARDATTRWGTGHMGGVILITTKR